ncbi:MAG: hypothetical protein JW776_05310 [Candidatus Lokiarchaeota archaeon]|nr:hypothetical protein [Candidatus Lokiarchaeota archaeon]
MTTYTIVSITHSDDFDGIGSQATLYRYFSILEKPIPPHWGFDPDTKVSLFLFQVDYQDYLFYWAAIITGFKLKESNSCLNFKDEWIATYLRLHNVHSLAELSKKHNIVPAVTEKKILDNIEIWKTVDLVIVTDIGYNKIFTTLFDPLEEYQIPFAYFDHHRHDESSINFYSRNCVQHIIDTYRCTTQITHTYFLPNDQISQYISDLGYDTDNNYNILPHSKEIMAVISYHRKNYSYLCDIVRNYASGVNFDISMKKEYEKIKKWEDKEFQMMLQSLKCLSITYSDGKTVNIIFGCSELRSGRSMNLLEDAINNGDLLNKIRCRCEDNRIILVTVNRTTLNTNLKSEVFNVHDIAEHFGGGGHINRAGFRFPSRFVSELTRSQVNLKDLNLEAFIEEIKQFL